MGHTHSMQDLLFDVHLPFHLCRVISISLSSIRFTQLEHQY